MTETILERIPRLVGIRVLFGLAGLLIMVAPWEFMDTQPYIAWGLRLMALTAVVDGWMEARKRWQGSLEREAGDVDVVADFTFLRAGFYIMVPMMGILFFFLLYLTIKGIVSGSI